MYSVRYVAFLDILGFSDIVRKTDHDPTPVRVNAIAESLTEIGSHHASVNESDDFQFQSFSDSIVMSSALTPKGLLHILNSISELSIRLLSVGLLLRGAIAKGNLYHDGSVIFGAALLDAYAIETNIAKYPRLILSRDVYCDFQVVASSLQIPQVLLAEDGPPYLHVFARLRMLNEAPATFDYLNSEEALQAQACQRAIQNLLDDSIYEPRHYEKLRWLAIYWNSTVAAAAPGDALKSIIFPFGRQLSGRRE
jgi:hypothetical protein